MKNRYLNKFTLLVCTLSVLFLTSCESEDENVLYVPPVIGEVSHPNDVYIQGLLNEYGTAVRWRWDDRFIKPDQSATPIADSLVIPVTKLLEHFWIGAYASQGEPGKEFIKELFPPEIQYIGSLIYEKNGTALLGYAESGARITLLDLNNYDAKDRAWLGFPTYDPKETEDIHGGLLATVHHEFGHIVHQTYGFPEGYNTVSEEYNGAGWSNGVTPLEARKMGMVSPYGTCDEREDFCELLSHYLIMPKAEFEQKYLIPVTLNIEELLKENEELPESQKIDIEALLLTTTEENAGKEKIAIKLGMLKEYFIKSFNIDLEKVQASLETDLNYLIDNNEIPLNKTPQDETK